MTTFVVEYTTEQLVGNQTRTMEIEADDLASAWLIVDVNYPHICADSIYPLGEGYDEDDGQPTEYEEWMSFDPDC